MKKSLIYLFSLLCMLTLVTSCSDDERIHFWYYC